MGVLGSCGYGQLSKADFLQGPLSFESALGCSRGPCRSLCSAQMLSPFSCFFYSKRLAAGSLLSPADTQHPSLPHWKILYTPLLPGWRHFHIVPYQPLCCLRFAIDPQNDSTLDLCYCEREEFIRCTTIQKLLL